MKINYILVFILSCTMFLSCKQSTTTTNYYFDSVNGNDANAGTSPDKAFKSFSKLSELKVKAGDSILLKSGSVFTEKLYFSGKGEAAKPIVIGKYGGEAKPHVKGNASEKQMVHIYNSEHIVVSDLEISNKGEKPVDGLKGVMIEIENYGDAHNTTIKNLFIHDINGGVEIEKGGGIALALQNSRDDDTIRSCFVDLVVENCVIKDSQRDGIRMMGSWLRNKWYPNKGVIIRNNTIDGVPGDGIVVAGCNGALVEYNVMKNCPATLPPSEACDGIWPWSSDNTLVQFNVVSDHRSIVDGYAYDSDWNCRNSVFQYNLSYNNDGGFMLVIATTGWPDSMCVNGNDDTQIRYNISINDGLRAYKTEHGYKNKDTYYSPIMHLTGLTKNTMIENNLFYIPPKINTKIDNTIMHFSNHDSAYGLGDIFRNNYIYTAEEANYADEEGSVNNVFSDNLFVGPLKTPASGFKKYDGIFDKTMWYDTNDKNWDTLVNFVKDKTVLLNGKEIPVLEIIGYK